MACAWLWTPPGRVPRSAALKDPEPSGVQTTAWVVPSDLSDQPATSPASLIETATLKVPPRVPRSVMVKDPDPDGVQTTAWVCPSRVSDAPATSPAGLIASTIAVGGTPRRK